MNRKELQLVASFLEMLDDILGNRCCNDWDFPDDWTESEKTDFVKQFHEANGDPEEYTEGDTIIQDFCAVYLVRQKVLQDLAGE